MDDRNDHRPPREPNPTPPGLQARRWKKIRDWFRTGGVPMDAVSEEEDGPPTARDGK